MGKIRIGELIKRMEPVLEATRRAQQLEAHRVLQEKIDLELKRGQEEYDRPLPEFLPRIPREIMVRLLTYVVKVFNDAARVVLDIAVDKPLRYSWYYGSEDIRMRTQAAAQRLKNFKDRPVQEFAVAIRLAELKPIAGEDARVTIAVLYVLHKTSEFDREIYYSVRHRDLSRRIKFRLENNLLKNIPELRDVLGEIFDVRMYDFGDHEFAELKKTGYKAEPGEEKVVHLEIF